MEFPLLRQWITQIVNEYLKFGNCNFVIAISHVLFNSNGFQYLSVEFGFRIQIVSGIPDSLSCIPDSKGQDSWFHELKFLRYRNPDRPFAASDSRGTKPPRWRAKVAPGQDKHRKITISNYVSLLFVLSQWDFCSPAWRFCTTWMASCKGPITVHEKV